ncbi:MAG: S1 family peptidase [Bdellovibrionales bacterium]|nr:S1 family peptidase [Bdellovibrionales bacterium]
MKTHVRDSIFFLCTFIFLGFTIAESAIAANTGRDTVFVPKPKVLQALLREDITRDETDAPFRFAVDQPLSLTTLNRGRWEVQPSGLHVWHLKIIADGSFSLNLGFEKFFLPKSAQLIVSAENKTPLRPFTAADNELHGQLWTPPIRGNILNLELRVAASEKHKVQLELNHINYGYRDFNQREIGRFRRSGACNIDVACVAHQPGFDGVIRSVAAITVRGSYACSGSLINNTNGDQKMYFLTAAHCGVGAGNAPSMVAIWNYQNSKCREPNSPASGDDGDGKQDQFHSGAIFRASNKLSDFTLVELDDPNNPEFQLYWAGWNRSPEESPAVAGIHHPRVADKRIAISNLKTSTTSYTAVAVPGDGSHVRVSRWTSGTTEPGSSGSPLFDNKYRIIGQLHGGGASCSRPEDSDWYGRLSVSWEGGGTPATRLKDWLDPKNSGVTTLEGRQGLIRGVQKFPLLRAVSPND